MSSRYSKGYDAVWRGALRGVRELVAGGVEGSTVDALNMGDGAMIGSLQEVNVASAEIIHDDRWGQIIDCAGEGYVEIRWFDTTEHMTGEEFNAWLTAFAGHVERARRAGALVDAIQFRMPRDRMSTDWRDANIIPRYNSAGLRKFAFIMPAGMPAIGKEPAREGPGQFLTGYFGSRADALAWLKA